MGVIIENIFKFSYKVKCTQFIHVKGSRLTLEMKKRGELKIIKTTYKTQCI